MLCISYYQWRRHFPPVKQSSLWEYHPSNHTESFAGCFHYNAPPQAPSCSAPKKTCLRQLIKASARSWSLPVIKESGITPSRWCRIATVISPLLEERATSLERVISEDFQTSGAWTESHKPHLLRIERKNPGLHRKLHLSWGKPGGWLQLDTVRRSLQASSMGPRRHCSQRGRFWVWRLQIWTDLEENLSCEAWWTFAAQGEVEAKGGGQSLWKKEFYLGNDKKETVYFEKN